MAEELVLDIKTNLGQATKDTKEYKKSLEQINEEISIQNEEIVRQEKILIKLKAQQDKNSKGGWSAGMSKLNDKIRDTSELLDLEKNTLKELNNKKKEATQEVKKNTQALKEGNKESKESVANFQFMGVSLNGVKKGFSQVIPTAKAMFGTIKAGIMSTGIGALVLAVIALTQSFKRSEEGQEKFQRIMAAIGAVTSQVLDLFSDLGETIIEAVTSPMKALESLGNGIVKFFKDPIGAARDIVVRTTIAVKEFVEETSKEVDALDEITKARQKAHHIDRALKVERAKANREINDIRLQAEDREKFNATERIALLRKAQAIEEGITAKEIESKQILINAQKLEMEQGLNTIEDKDKLAQLQAELINLDTKKLRSQRLLQTQITTAINEEKALKEQQIADAQKIIDDEFDAKIKANDEWNKKQIADAKMVADAKIKETQRVADVEKQIAIAVESFKKATIQQGFGAAAAMAGENVALSKGVAAAQVIYNTQQGIMAAMGATSIADKLLPYPLRLANAISTGVMGAAALSTIMSTSPTGGSNNPAPNTGGGGTPAPQMMSGAFDISGGVAPEATKAYVVTDEMSNSQNQLANIRRRATI